MTDFSDALAKAEASLAAVKSTQVTSDANEAALAAEIRRLEARIAELEAGAPPPPVTYIALGDNETVTVGTITNAKTQCDASPKNSLFKRSDNRGFKFVVESGDDWNGTERSEIICPRLASGAFTLTATVNVIQLSKATWLLFTQGHQSANTGNPPASVKFQNGEIRCDIAPPIVEVGNPNFKAAVGTFPLVFAMRTPRPGVTGRFYVKWGNTVLCDYTGALGTSGDSVDPKFGIYRSDTNETYEIEFVDPVVVDGFTTTPLIA